MVAIIEMEEGARILSLVTGDPPSKSRAIKKPVLHGSARGSSPSTDFRTLREGRHPVNFDLTPEQELFQSTLRDFVNRQIRPVARDWEHEGRYPTEIVSTMKDMGLFGDSMPLTNSATSTVVSQLSTNG